MRQLPSAVSGWIIWCAGVTCFAVFLTPALHAPPMGDDWISAWAAHGLLRESGFWGAILRTFTTVVGDFWRPLEFLPLVVLGTQTLSVILILKSVVIAALTLLTVQIALDLKIPTVPAFIAGTVLLLHQDLVACVSELDHWGDAFCGLALMVLLWSAIRYDQGRLRARTYLFLTAAFGTVSLASKEAGVISFATPAALLIFSPHRISDRRRTHFLALAICIGITLLYLHLRFQLGLGLTSTLVETTYQLGLGWGVVRNAALFVIALLCPVCTVDIMLNSPGSRIVAAGFILALSALCLLGLRELVRRRQWKGPALLFCLFFVNQGPVFLMHNPTEGNMARSLPLGLLCITLCLLPLFNRASRIWRGALAVLLGAWLVLNISALREKVLDVVRQHERYAEIRRSIQTLMPNPTDSVLTFVAVTGEEPKYDVYFCPFASSLPCEIPYALMEMYHQPALRTKLRMCNPADTVRVAWETVDFVIELPNHVRRNVRLRPAVQQVDTPSVSNMGQTYLSK